MSVALLFIPGVYLVGTSLVGTCLGYLDGPFDLPTATGFDVSTGPLLARALKGDSGAISELVKLYHDRVYRFGVRVCRDEFDADDAVQSAFVTLARRPDAQKSPQVAAWLFQVVKNACLTLMKRAGLQRRASFMIPVKALK